MQNHRRFLHNDHILAWINNHQGFTLVEVLIALLVLGILFVPVSNAFLQSVKLNQHLQQRVTAVRDAQAAMEVTLAVMKEHEEVVDPQERSQNSEVIIEEIIDKDIEVVPEKRSNDILKVNVGESVENVLLEETPPQLAEEITQMLSNFNSTGIIKPDTIIEIAPLHENSPFLIITATSPSTNTNANAAGSTNNFTLTTLHLPGEAPWLTPKEYRVVTP